MPKEPNFAEQIAAWAEKTERRLDEVDGADSDESRNAMLARYEAEDEPADIPRLSDGSTKRGRGVGAMIERIRDRLRGKDDA